MSKQRIVVITGGGSGMGRASALKFARSGDKVYIVGRHLDRLEETAKLAENIRPLVADVTDLESIKKLKEELVKNEKTIDVLVNNAGGRGDKRPDENASLDELVGVWNEVIKLNLSSVYYVVRALSDIINPGGRIINISSLAALAGSSQGGVVGAAYAAAKSGVHAIDKTLAKSLAERKITINSIAPGLIQSTDFFGREGIPDRVKERYGTSILVGRLGEPEDIAGGVFYLASDEASFITGEILNINGGVLFGR